MSLFHHNTIRFNDQDPLDDGLNDEIAAERHESDAFGTLDDVNGSELAKHWNDIVKDIEKDPDWFTFDED